MMKDRTPAWINIAAAVLIGEFIVLLVTGSVKGIGLIALPVVGVIGWFLLRGSKAAWVLALLVAIGQAVASVTGDQPKWVIVSALLIVAALLAPSSRAFVWHGHRPHAERLPYTEYFYRLMASLGSDQELVSKTVIVRMVVAVGVLFLANGVLYAWHDGVDDESGALRVLSQTVYIIGGLAQLALLAVLAATAYRWIKVNRRRRSTGSPHP